MIGLIIAIIVIAVVGISQDFRIHKLERRIEKLERKKFEVEG